MKLNQIYPVFISLAIVISLLILSPLSTNAAPATGNGTTISDISMELKNRTGLLSGSFEATGTAPEGTDHVNITFAYSNSTAREELGIWFEPVNALFLGNGMALIPTGGGEDNWTTWKFTVKLNIPIGGGITDSLSMIATMLGFDLPDLGDLENLTELGNMEGLEDIENLTGIDDLENLLDLESILSILQDTEILLVAHAVDGDGQVTMAQKDFKLEAINTAFTFLQEEGIIEAPPGSTDDDEKNGDIGKEKGEDDPSPIILITILVAGGTILVLVAIIAAVFITLNRKK